MLFRSFVWCVLGIIIQSVFIVLAIQLGIPFNGQSLIYCAILESFVVIVLYVTGNRGPLVVAFLDGMAMQSLLQGLEYSGIIQIPLVSSLIPPFLNEGPIAIAGIAGHAALQLELGVIALLSLALMYGSITVLATLWRKARPATQ